MTKLRTLLPFAVIASTLGFVACSSDSGGQSDEDIVNISHTDVANQAIGNCWIYAGTGWAESLHLGYSGEALNLSESWQTYVDWYFGILADDVSEKDGITTGGWFGESMHWTARFGFFDEGAFIPSEATAMTSRRQASALAAINTSLKSGVLSDPAKRRDREVVRAELDRVWELDQDVIAAIDNTFGRTLTKDFTTTAQVPAGVTGLRSPASISVGYDLQANKEITLADAVGTDASSWNPRTRKGTYAWNEESYPSSASARRTFQIKMQRALHQRRPVAISWFVDFNARKNGVFAAPPESPGSQGGHITLLEDYQINNVPGFGLLEAGVLVTDPAVLDAALSPQANIEFLRVKNSWGVSSPNLTNDQQEDLRGYNDLHMAYLDAQLQTCATKDANGKCQGAKRNGLTGMTFPSAAWVNVGLKPVPVEPEPQPEPQEPTDTCSHSMCTPGPKLEASCSACADLICDADPYCCNTLWDGICVRSAKEICELQCDQ